MKPNDPVKPVGKNYRESGSPSAPIGLEIYEDYECPPCAAFSRDVAPLLAGQYVGTGKVKLLYRDFPLPTHPFAKLAARYADAAGQLGYYEVARNQIFTTQQAWRETGDIDAQVSAVLPVGVMKEVRERVTSSQALDDELAADLAVAREDHLNQTPSVVIVYKGKRSLIPGAVSFDLLKRYLDELLQQ